MKKVRTLFIGLLLGGGIGITASIEIAPIFGHEESWFLIEVGLKIGAALGMAIASFALLADAIHSRA
ncbi:MAG: hypothetical protein ABJE80_03235 [Reichenbachiella sp.]|uniref:hypothetical protein n=1 Tax=Reichenbachiella sp. TaxID=2184521 RepID=UPI00326779EF